MAKHGQQEGDGLATSCFSDADEVTSRHDGRDGLGLDRGRLLIVVSGQETERNNTNIGSVCERLEHALYSLLHRGQHFHGNPTLHPRLDGLRTAFAFDDDSLQLQTVLVHLWNRRTDAVRLS